MQSIKTTASVDKSGLELIGLTLATLCVATTLVAAAVVARTMSDNQRDLSGYLQQVETRSRS